MPDPDAPRMTSMRVDAGAHEPADLVEPAHDLCIAPEEDRSVLLLEKGKSGVGPAAGLEGEARRVEAGALQPSFRRR